MSVPDVPTSSARSDGPASDHKRLDLPASRRLGLTGLTCVIFFTACGGAFGLEPLVGAVGPGWAIVLILVTPVLWSLPTALMVAELASMLPAEGGYYVWVKVGLGRFWGLQEGWWTIGSSVVLMAIFPVLFVSYLGYFFPILAQSADAPGSWHGPLLRWLLAVAFVACSAAVNWRGAKAVGRFAELGAVFVLGAFALLSAIGLLRNGALAAASHAIRNDLSRAPGGTLLLGLSTVIFNYGGWDNVSTFAEEVDDPTRNYPRGLAVALLATVVAYVLPVLAGIGATTDAAVWSADQGWPVIGASIGGPWLGGTLAAAALVGTWLLFNAQVLYVSRLPSVMAQDGWLPRALAGASPTTGVPTVALGWSCALAAVAAALSFGDLVILQTLLYGLSLLLELLALAAFRVRAPDASRGFRIPGGWLGIAYVCVAPMCVAATVLLASLREQRSHASQLLLVAAIVASGVVLYFFRREARPSLP